MRIAILTIAAALLVPAVHSSAAEPQAQKAVPPCVTIREKVTASKHQIDNQCRSDLMVTLRWKSPLRTETSSYRLMGTSPSQRQIDIINPGSVEVVGAAPIDSKCVANHCPTANPGRIKVAKIKRGSDNILQLDNSHSTYAFVQVEIIEHPGTPREAHSTVHGLWDIGKNPLFASQDPFDFKLLVAEAELN